MRRTWLHSALALGFVILWTVVPVLSVVHAAASEHVYCAEHERLEEGRDIDLNQLAAEDGFYVGRERVDHEQCAHTGEFLREASSVLSSIAITTTTPELAIGILVFAIAPLRQVELFKLAPKGSPPSSIHLI